ncbi:MAG TPA: hypothetical protein VK171_17205 [Fimbriimonas sp.]|nr:hypothetical protein [Fimbriimonas sp.]
MIPKELDELMWLVAESGDPDAIEDFQERHPIYQGELLKRIRTVRALKDAGRAPKAQPPVFVSPTTTAPQFKWWVAAVAFGALSVVAVGAWRMMPPSYNHTPTDIGSGAPVYTEARSSGPAAVQPSQKDTFSNNEPINTPPLANQSNPNDQTQKPTEDLPVYPIEQPKTVSLEMAPLHTAIQAIAASGNYVVTIAPGTPNPEVKVNFENMTPFEMLKRLGDEYAFVPVIDGEYAILIIPKKDDIPQASQNDGETR